MLLVFTAGAGYSGISFKSGNDGVILIPAGNYRYKNGQGVRHDPGK